MEPSESQHINKHIDELVKQTKCTVRLKTILKRKDLISDEEVENLASKGRNSRFEEAMHLYDILITRKDAYDGLIEALKETNQTGALDILQRKIKARTGKSKEAVTSRKEPPTKKSRMESDEEEQEESSRPGESLQSLSFPDLVKILQDSSIFKDSLPYSFKDPKVKKPTKPMEFEDDFYKLPAGFKGLFLLINVIKFGNSESGAHTVRHGAAVDTRRLEVVFETLGYQVYTYSSKEETFTREKFTILIDKFKKRCAELDVKSFAVFLGSHGTDGKLIMSNGDKIDLETEVFTKLCSPPDNSYDIGINHWLNIPKMFFIQACRPREKDGLAAISNCLISYACKSDTFAWKSVSNGSDYVAALTKYLCKYSAEKDILYILDKVRRQVRDESKKFMKTADDIQEPEYVTKGEFKKLYFNMLPNK